MLGILLKINIIILGNLLAFYLIGLILDALFGTGNLMRLISICFSLPVLGLIMYLKAGKLLQDIQTISPINDNRESNK